MDITFLELGKELVLDGYANYEILWNLEISIKSWWNLDLNEANDQWNLNEISIKMSIKIF